MLVRRVVTALLMAYSPSSSGSSSARWQMVVHILSTRARFAVRTRV